MKLKQFPQSIKEMLPIYLKICTIIIASIALFFQDLTIIFKDALQSEITSYILVVPFILAYIIYRKRNILKAVIAYKNPNSNNKTKHLSTIFGILICITAILIYWYGSYTFTPLEYHGLTIPIFVTGLTLILFNPQTVKELVFPIILLFLLTPPPSQILHFLGSSLSLTSSQASYAITSALGINSTLINEYGNPIIEIIRPNGTITSFAVDIACSGIYSLLGFMIFAILVSYIIRDKPLKKFTIFIIGFFLMYILNISRIVIILLIGYSFGEELALNLFHLFGGWFLIFLGTILLLIFSDKILKAKIFADEAKKYKNYDPLHNLTETFSRSFDRVVKPTKVRLKKTDILKIVAIIGSVMFFISIQAPVFALTEGPAQIIIQTPSGEQGNTQLLPEIQDYTLHFIYRDRNFEELAGQDASLLYAYKPLDQTKEIIQVMVEIGSATSKLHRWEYCLISWQLQRDLPPQVTQLDLKDIQIQENPPIIARYFAFQWTNRNQTQAVLYWYETAIFSIEESSALKSIKISLITLPASPEALTEPEMLMPLATTIAEHWEPIKIWSPISLLLSESSLYLAIIITVLLTIFLVLYVIENRKQRKTNFNVYQKLSMPNKRFIDLVIETEKATTPTLTAIANTYRKKIGKITKEELLYKITEAEKTGIIQRAIKNIYDQPIQIWKILMIKNKTIKG